MRICLHLEHEVWYVAETETAMPASICKHIVSYPVMSVQSDILLKDVDSRTPAIEINIEFIWVEVVA